MHIKSIRQNRARSKATRERIDRRYTAMYATHTPTRHDFTTPRQMIKEALKVTVKTSVIPTFF